MKGPLEKKICQLVRSNKTQLRFPTEFYLSKGTKMIIGHGGDIELSSIQRAMKNTFLHKKSWQEEWLRFLRNFLAKRKMNIWPVCWSAKRLSLSMGEQALAEAVFKIWKSWMMKVPVFTKAPFSGRFGCLLAMQVPSALVFGRKR